MTNKFTQTECDLPLLATQEASETMDASLNDVDIEEEEVYVIGEVEGFDVED